MTGKVNVQDKIKFPKEMKRQHERCLARFMGTDGFEYTCTFRDYAMLMDMEHNRTPHRHFNEVWNVKEGKGAVKPLNDA